MAKVRLINLVKNGSFENDFNSWSSVRANMTIDSTISAVGDKCMKVTGVNGQYQWLPSNKFDVPDGHKVYVQAMVKNNDATTAWGLYGLGTDGTSQKTNISVGHVGVIHNEFTKISQYITIPTGRETNSVNVLLYGEQSVANANLITYWDGIICIDLTACYGQGKEPSKEWCDCHISHFEGSVQLDTTDHVLLNQVQDPLFLFHDNTDDLYNTYGITVRITNLIQGGNMENGVPTGFNANANLNFGSNESSYDGAFMVAPNLEVYTGKEFTVNVGHKYYCAAMVYPSNDNAMGICVDSLYGSQHGVWVDYSGYSSYYTWQKKSGIFTPTANDATIRVLLGTAYASQVDTYCSMDNAMLIDLTDAFGAGNEPTKEWCDKFIYYFDGTIPCPDYGHMIESIDGEIPPHSRCHRSWGSGYHSEIYFVQKKTISYIKGHKYYAAMDFYAYEANQGYNLYWPQTPPYPSLDGGMVVEKNRPAAVGGMWQKASMIVQGDSVASGKHTFRFDNDNVKIQGRTLRVTNLMCIDLTMCFGAGNEPDLAWCDKYLVLDSDGTPYIRTKDTGSDYVSNNTNHINFIMKQRSKRVRTRIQSLDHNDMVLDEIKGYCTGGSLDITNGDMIRRSIGLDFVAANKLEINKNSPFWINKRLKIFTGIDDYRGNTYWFDHGIFVPTQPDTSISLSGRTISIAALDKMVLADNPVLMTTKINVNTPIGNAIRSLSELYGETKVMINNLDYTLPYDYEMSAGDSIQEAMKEITNLYMNYDLYYDTNGFLVYEKQKNRVYDNPIWDFYGDNDFTISRQASADYTKVYNDFKVFGYYDDEKATQPTYQITITDNSHPFSVDNMKRKHSLVISEDNYLTVDQCKARCEFEKQQAENLINNFSITTAPIYSINDVNKVIKVTDNGNRYTCLIDSISYPLDIESPMSIACHEIFI